MKNIDWFIANKNISKARLDVFKLSKVDVIQVEISMIFGSK